MNIFKTSEIAKKSFLILLLATGATASQAAILTILPNSASDATKGTVALKSDPVVNASEKWPAIGNYSQTFNSNAGFSFKLPTIPEGQTISSVSFTAYNDGNQGVIGNVVVYGIRHSANATWLASDYGMGPTQSGTLLNSNWALKPGNYLTPVDVTSFVTNGYNSGDTVFIRISLDADPATVMTSAKRAWFLGLGAETGDPHLPTMTITTVPEPATCALLAGLAVLGICWMRNRR